MEIGRKRKKLQRKEDRISDLPDHIIQHILSFLPSTKQAIQTSILSKRWRNQWTHVPVLILDSPGMSYENFLKFIRNTLNFHYCSKIKKFHLQYPCSKNEDTDFDAEILFPTRRHVEELYLSSTTKELLQKQPFSNGLLVKFPKFLFNNASLVKLTAVGFIFVPDGKVNWGCLTALNIVHCKLTDEAMKHILSGSPLLESLEVSEFLGFHELDVASKSLKRLVLKRLEYHPKISALEISCPNLRELSFNNVSMDDPKSFAQVIENVLSTSPLLESIELITTDFGKLDQLVIASNSLKRLVLSSTSNIFQIEISCPHIEELEISGCLNVITAYKLLNFSPSLCATIDFYHYWNSEDGRSSTIEIRKSLVKDILLELQHVKELKIGSSFIEFLSTSELEELFSPLLNLKCLTLNSPNLNSHYFAISCLLRNVPVLEKLVINALDYDKSYAERPKLNDFVESFWNSNATFFNCLVSHMKTIKIVGFPKKDGNRKLMVNFIQFLLNNARLLEKMVVVLKDHGTTSQSKIYPELLSLTRYSRCATIKVVC